MEHIAAFMLLVACPGDNASCQETVAPQPAYETVEACQAEIFAIPVKRLGSDKLLATCVAVDPAAAFEDAQIVWDITVDGRLVAELHIDNVDQVPGSS